MPNKAELSQQIPPREEPIKSTEIWRPTNVDIITISGHPGTGKTVTGQGLANYLDMEYIKVGALFRDFVKETTGAEVVGYTPRSEDMDQMLDDMQRSLIRNARTEGRKIILEGRLAGVIATEEQIKARNEHSPISRVERVLFVADRAERINRVLKRYPEYSPEEALRLTLEREQQDLSTWQQFHPSIQGLSDIYDPTLINESGLPRFADIIVDTSNLTVHEAVENIHQALVENGSITKEESPKTFPYRDDIFPGI